MKKQKETKLQLINFLSNPDIEILDWIDERETKDIPIKLTCDPWGWIKKEYTGRTYLKITLAINDCTNFKTTTRKTKRAKTKGGTIPPPPARRED